ncbi:MAG: hypothetical protein K6G22_12765 [Lachnospiraceae bacterium]|nr:hypothetical protein [Lachnospiraceae bacterium]
MKRTSVMVLCLVLVTGMFAGCGSKDKIDNAGRTHVLSDPETGEVLAEYSEEEWQKRKAEEEASKCHHPNLDANGFCEDCGEDVGFEIRFDEAETYFNIALSGKKEVTQEWNGTTSGYFEYHITPNPEYKDCRFTNVMVTIYGTTDDGTTRHINEDLGTGVIDETGEGYITGYMYNVCNVNAPNGMKVLSNGSGTTPRIHYKSGTSKANGPSKDADPDIDVSDSPVYEPVPVNAEATPEPVPETKPDILKIPIGEDEFDKYFTIQNSKGWYYAVVPKQEYINCTFENIDVELTVTLVKDNYTYDELLHLQDDGSAYHFTDGVEVNVDCVNRVTAHDPYVGKPCIYISEEKVSEIKKASEAESIVLKEGDFDKYMILTELNLEDPDGGHIYAIDPKPEYKDCRFENINIKVSGKQNGKYVDELGSCGLPSDARCSIYLSSGNLTDLEVHILPHNKEDGDPMIYIQ